MAQIKINNISGKGNVGKYIDRLPAIYAAGVRTLQPDLRLVDCLNYISDVPNNDKKIPVLPQLQKSTRSSGSKDMRNAGLYCEGSQLINPPVMTKFETLVEDLKSTVYKSYWNKQVGKSPDNSFSLPPNLNIKQTTFGKKTIRLDNFNIITPDASNAYNSDEILSSRPGYQLNRNYCRSSCNPNKIHSIKINSGNSVKCCLTDEKIIMGTYLRQPMNLAQQNFNRKNRAELGVCSTPNQNIKCVSEGHVFGKVEPKDNAVGCFSDCELNSRREVLKNCLAHLNTLRKCLSKRFDGLFFRNFYLELKHTDVDNKGWLPKELIYHLCTTKYIRFNATLLEPLLSMWDAVTNLEINYKIFIDIINYREPLPRLPKVTDFPSECTNFISTYMDMVKPHNVANVTMAGIPSGRFFDKDYPITPEGYCKADRSYLSHESDAKACLCPSLFTLLGISHRDMYAARNPEIVKRVFNGAGENLNEDMFNIIWEDAAKTHPMGLVCYETFRQALNAHKIKRNIT